MLDLTTRFSSLVAMATEEAEEGWRPDEVGDFFSRMPAKGDQVHQLNSTRSKKSRAAK